jgi:hypothetical protein
MAETKGSHQGMDFLMDPDSDPPKLEIAGRTVAVQKDRNGKFWTSAHPHRNFDSLQELMEATIAIKKQ